MNIELGWNYGSRPVNGSAVLQWDTGKDIIQFGWLPEMAEVSIQFWMYVNDERRYWKKDILYQVRDEIVTSHAFLIVRIAAEQGGVDETPQKNRVIQSDLKQTQYAKDLLAAPPHGATMKLVYKMPATDWGDGEYEFPAGYALLLRYKNETQSIV